MRAGKVPLRLATLARVFKTISHVSIYHSHTHTNTISNVHTRKPQRKSVVTPDDYVCIAAKKRHNGAYCNVVHLKVSTLISGLYLTSFGYIDLTSISYICYIVDLYVYTFIFSKSETVKLLMTLRRIPLYDASLYGFVVIFVEPCISVVFEFKSLVHTIITKVLFTY